MEEAQARVDAMLDPRCAYAKSKAAAKMSCSQSNLSEITTVEVARVASRIGACIASRLVGAGFAAG